MVVPNHYSRDIPMRCHSLIRHLLPVVSDGLPDDARFGGALRTTFLLAMATPMIVLPIERIFKSTNARAAQVGDDRDLDPLLADKLRTVLGDDRSFGDATFAQAGKWRYVPEYPVFNIGHGWPDALLDSLAEPQAAEKARNAPAKRILLDLRNALAHGGVAYLDTHGRNADGPAAMFAFVASVRRNGQTTVLNVLRVDEDAFADFLAAWTDWLTHQDMLIDALNEHTVIAV